MRSTRGGRGRNDRTVCQKRLYHLGSGYLFRQSAEVLVAISRVRHGHALVTTTMPQVDSLSPLRSSGDMVWERGCQLTAPTRLNMLLFPAHSPLLSRSYLEPLL